MAELNATPKGMRLHIAVFGRRNAGKSSLINAITRQDLALVSPIAGTTTDPVEKEMEIQPLGPVIVIDTAGIDDVGDLGAARVERTRRVVGKTDIAIIAIDPALAGGGDAYERELADELVKRSVPFVIAITKSDAQDRPTGLLSASEAATADLLGGVAPIAAEAAAIVSVSAETRAGIEELVAALGDARAGKAADPETIAADLVGASGLAVLVVPIDDAAPKGRLILPQVQTIRDLLDGHCSALVVQDTDLAAGLAKLAGKPDIVITDSQAFAQVARIVPEDVPLTGFSILMARLKGDLAELSRGAGALGRLSAGDRVLIAESCTHHPVCDDIGTVKIPRLLETKLCAGLSIEHCQGNDFPTDLADYDLVVHCGGCMLNRTAMLERMARCAAAGVPVTNYGMTIAHALGILPRALAPFPEALAAYRAS